MGIRRYQLHISGRVQGVGYRASTQLKAHQLGLTGWVRNQLDGDVEIVVEGDSTALNQFVEWAWQGPRFAKVEQIAQTESIASGEFHQFDIR